LLKVPRSSNQPRAAQRGDFTGRETERLTRENAEALVQRQKEVGLVNQIDTVVEEEGIFDPATGKLIEMPPEAQAKIEELENTVTYVEDDEIFDVGRGQPQPPPQQDIETKQMPKPERANPMEIQDVSGGAIIVEEEYKVIRVNTDVEGMTYGVGNTIDFYRGRKYRVPIDLYHWLESRGVVYH
jgi:hypothetical protein